jgi:hypothetical protein
MRDSEVRTRRESSSEGHRAKSTMEVRSPGSRCRRGILLARLPGLLPHPVHVRRLPDGEGRQELLGAEMVRPERDGLQPLVQQQCRAGPHPLLGGRAARPHCRRFGISGLYGGYACSGGGPIAGLSMTVQMTLQRSPRGETALHPTGPDGRCRRSHVAGPDGVGRSGLSRHLARLVGQAWCIGERRGRLSRPPIAAQAEAARPI